MGRLILVDEPIAVAGPRARTAVYARVSSADQKADLDRQVTRVTAWASRAGRRAGKRVGFARFKRKGRDTDRVCFTTGAMRVESGRRHLTLLVIGTVRTHGTPAVSNG